MRKSFEIIEEFSSKRGAREKFFWDVLDSIKCKIGAQGAKNLACKIVKSAIDHGVRKDPLIVLFALGCALESTNICSGVVKPNDIKSGKVGIHNFLSDMDNIYIAMSSRCLLENENYKLLTLDKNLAAFWSVLSPERISYSDGLLSFSYKKRAEEIFLEKLSSEDREHVFSMCFGG